jgi:hypothetical protein
MMDGAVPWPEELAAIYRNRGYWRPEPLGELGRRWAQATPDRIAVVDAERGLACHEFDDLSDRRAAGLWRIGVRSGDRVIVQLSNTAEFAAVLLARSCGWEGRRALRPRCPGPQPGCGGAGWCAAGRNRDDSLRLTSTTGDVGGGRTRRRHAVPDRPPMRSTDGRSGHRTRTRCTANSKTGSAWTASKDAATSAGTATSPSPR